MEPFHADVVLQHAVKPPFWARIEGHPLLDEVGGIDKYIVTGTDVTEERQQKTMQNNFCSMVSHELRTPLTVVSGTLEALEFGSCGDVSQEAMELIQMGQRNCSHLSALIEDVLEINHLESGEIPISMQPVPIADVVQDVITTMDALFETSGHSLHFRNGADQAIIMADSTRIRQVMTNLLSNARKFSRPGTSVTVSLSCEQTVNIEVSDQGCGIPIAFQPELFERFSRDVSVRANGVEGFGLGLSITKKLVDQMKGTISFESTEGVGTTFRVAFPRFDAAGL
jgi:signal transduction histidine kinase